MARAGSHAPCCMFRFVISPHTLVICAQAGAQCAVRCDLCELSVLVQSCDVCDIVCGLEPRCAQSALILYVVGVIYSPQKNTAQRIRPPSRATGPAARAATRWPRARSRSPGKVGARRARRRAEARTVLGEGPPPRTTARTCWRRDRAELPPRLQPHVPEAATVGANGYTRRACRCERLRRRACVNMCKRRAVCNCECHRQHATLSKLAEHDEQTEAQQR